ncbi:MAG: DUF4294 domain-containing protein [Sphingobacteriales bacterium]|nr:MAG: DUF4294 domain-containing protein [Sphingobacteriales bacterium]
MYIEYIVVINNLNSMKKAVFVFVCMFGFFVSVQAQEEKNKPGYKLPVQIIGKDTLPVYMMEEAVVEEKLDEADLQKQKDWNKMLRDVMKVWPYVTAFSDKLNEIETQMAALDKNRDKRKFLKDEEKKMKDEYEEKLKNLNYRQGKLLVKLIDRQTGRTSYQLIKEYKSGLTAMVWQGFASAFDLSLKEKYDPSKETQIESVIHYLGYK